MIRRWGLCLQTRRVRPGHHRGEPACHRPRAARPGAAVNRAQAAGITVLGYSSTLNGQRPAAAVEAEVAKYKAWYGVNGIFLDLTRGTADELSYYRQLASYIRATVPNAVVWLNPGTYPDQSFMSIANVVLVFEGPYAS
jgi:hypothetical protein